MDPTSSSLNPAIGAQKPLTESEIHANSIKTIEDFIAIAKASLEACKKMIPTQERLTQRNITNLQVIEESYTKLNELRKNISDFTLSFLFDPDLSVRQKIGELYAINNEDDEVISQINKYYCTLTEELVENLPTPPSSYRYANDLKENIKIHAANEPVKFYHTFKALSAKYSIQELQETGLFIVDIVGLFNNQPSLLEKIIHSKVFFESSICLKDKNIEPLLDLSIKFPEMVNATEVFLQEYTWSSEGLDKIIPFIEWINKNISTESKSQAVGSAEKFLALWLYDEKTFNVYITPLLQENKFQDLYEAMAKIHRLDEIGTVFKELGLVSKKDSKEEIKEAFKTLTADIQPEAIKWLKNRAQIFLPLNEVQSEDLETIVNTFSADELTKILLALKSFKSLDSETQTRIIGVMQIYPFNSENIIDFFAHATDLGKNKCLQLLNDHSDQTQSILRSSGSHRSKEMLLYLRDRFETALGKKEGAFLLEKLMQAKLPEQNLFEILLKMSDEDIAYFAPVLDKPLSGVFSNLNTWKVLLKEYPQAKEFWDRNADNVGNHASLFFHLLEKDPRLVVQLFSRYSNASYRLVDAILNAAISFFGKKDPIYVLAQHGFPAPILEDLCLQYSSSSMALQNYLVFQLERNQPEEKVIKEAAVLVDLNKVLKDDDIMRLINLLKDPGKEALAKAAFVLANEGCYEAIPTLLNLDVENNKDLIDSIVSENRLSQINYRRILEISRGHPLEKFTFPESISPKVRTFSLPLDSIQDLSHRRIVALEIAKNLLPVEGGFDLEQIAVIKESEAFRNLSFSESMKQKILVVLDVLQNDPEFSTRLLRFSTLPKEKTALYDLVRSTVGKQEGEQIDLRDVHICILSALLYPTLQGKIGSCFSTRSVIQSESYAAGLLQKLIDCESILSDNVIKRVQQFPGGGIVIKSFPVFLIDLAKNFPEDLLLARALEFTEASFNAAGESETSIYTEPVVNVFRRLVSGEPDEVRKLLYHSFNELIESLTDKILKKNYLSVKKNPKNDELGAWCLMNARTNALIETRDQYIEAFSDIIKEVREKLVNNHPALEKEIIIVFDQIHAWLESPSFSPEKYSSNERYNPLVRLNPQKYSTSEEGPWIIYGKGGSLVNIDKVNFGYPDLDVRASVCKDYTEERKLRYLFDTMIHLPKPLKTLAKQFPQFAIPISSNTQVGGHGSHAYSLIPREVLSLSEKYGTSEKVMEELNRRAESFKKTPLTPQLAQSIIEEMKKFCHPNVLTFFNRTLLSAELLNVKTVEDFWNQWMAEAGKLGLKKEFKSYLNGIYFTALNHTELKPAVPKLIIGNTNWDTVPHVCCLFDLSQDTYRTFFADDTFNVMPLELENVRFPNKWLYHNQFNLSEGDVV